jgi:flagellin-like protein
MKTSNHKVRRKGISPVLATVILIAITLIAAIAISGFVFGLFGTFTNTAKVEAVSYSCSGTPEVCTIGLENIGTANTALSGSCTLTFGGSSYNGVAAVASGSLNGGSSAVTTCTGPAGSHATVGSQIVGSILLNNGADILFSANGQ